MRRAENTTSVPEMGKAWQAGKSSSFHRIYSSYCPVPSRRILAFEDIDDVDDDDDDDDDDDTVPDNSVKRDRTEAVADMLLVNKRVDEIQIPVHNYTTFNQVLWNTLVVSRVERRKK
jgi:hypothetical protein